MFSKNFFFCFLVTLSFSIHLTLENSKVKAVVGTRIEGDKLILKDSLNSPITKKPLDHKIKFEYPIINKVISYIELRTNSNAAIQFEINEQKKGELLIGSATAIASKDFHLDVCVFGFNASEKPEKFKEILRLGYTGEIAETVDNNFQNELFDDENDSAPFDDEHEHDGRLVIGDRQLGDYLLYEKVNHINEELKEKRSLTFYYVDSDYVTCTNIITIKTTAAYAIYSEVTEHSIKAIIEEDHVQALSAIFRVYGYKPEDKPIDYYPMTEKLSKPKAIHENPCKCSGNYNFRFNNSYFISLLILRSILLAVF